MNQFNFQNLNPGNITRRQVLYQSPLSLPKSSSPSICVLSVHMIFIYLITSTIWCRTHSRVGFQFTVSVSLKITHPAKERMATPLGSTSPTLFEQWCGFFYIPQEPDKWKCFEMGPTAFRRCPRRLESLTVWRCHCKGSTFSSVI